jgi:hypothetical protein
MPKPSARLPHAGSATAAAEAPVIAPAPDNGVPFGERPAGDHNGARRPSRRQLGTRIDEELYECLVGCAEATHITIGRLVERGVMAELEKHGWSPAQRRAAGTN